MLKRIMRALGTNVYSQIINICIQLLSVPIFINSWGVDLYGEWLILFTIPSFISKGGANFSSAAANEIDLLYSKGYKNEAINLFKTTCIYTILPAVAFSMLFYAISSMVSLKEALNFQILTDLEIKAILIITFFYTVGAVLASLFIGVYRAVGLYARGIFTTNTIRAIEYIIVCVLVFLGKSPLEVATAFLSVRLVSFIWIFAETKSLQVWLNLKGSSIDSSALKQILKPSFSFMGLTLGDLINTQGLITLIGLTMGTTAVVSFSLVKTITNILRQFSSIINLSIWPEYSKLVNTEQLSKVKVLHRASVQSVLIATIICVVFMVSFQHQIFYFWVGKEVFVDPYFFLLMLVGMSLNVLWYSSSFIFISINKHARLSTIYFLLSIAIAASFLLFYSYGGLLVIPLSTILVNIVLLLLVFRDTCSFTHDNLKTFWVSVFTKNNVLKLYKN